MKDEMIVFENPKKLVIDKNSRFRIDSNLSELMESIKENGILQPITARKEDKRVICGNRRLGAALKLELNEVPVRYMSGIDDKQLLILNLLENMQRRDITTIEIGRQCDIMLKNSDFKLSVSELATKLGVSDKRIVNAVKIFKSLPEKFRDQVVHIENSATRKYGDLPENVVTLVLNFSRFFKPITDDEIDLLLTKVGEEKITVSEINLIGHMVQTGVSVKKSLKEYKNYQVMRADIIALKTELANVKKKEGIASQKELVNKIISYKYPTLF